MTRTKPIGGCGDEAPAYWNPDLSFWVLSRFEDVQNAFKDFDTFSSTEESPRKQKTTGRRPNGIPANDRNGPTRPHEFP